MKRAFGPVVFATVQLSFLYFEVKPCQTKYHEDVVLILFLNEEYHSVGTGHDPIDLGISD